MAAGDFETLAQWLRTHREAERYSLRQLAEALTLRGVKVSHGYLGKLENDPSPPDEISPRPSKAFIRAVASLIDGEVSVGERLAGYPPSDDDALPTDPLDSIIFEAGHAEDLTESEVALLRAELRERLEIEARVQAERIRRARERKS